MSKRKKILLGFLLVFIAIQFIRPAADTGSRGQSNDFDSLFAVPSGIQSILQDACYDCHSNRTIYPWYTVVQPFGWIMASHINEGRGKLDFSGFGNNSKRKQISKLKEMVNQLKDDEMPLLSYKLMHRKARLSPQDKMRLNQWLMSVGDSLQNK